VKRMIEAVGHSVIKLTRVRMGPLLLGDLASGEYRFLTDREANRLREVVQDRVARAEHPQLDASGKPVRWTPPTEPAPPRPPKPERSGRGPKSQRQESGAGSQRALNGAKAGRSGRGGLKRPLSPGAKFRRPTKTKAFQRPQPSGMPQGDDRTARPRPAASLRKPGQTQSGRGFERGPSSRTPQGSGPGSAAGRSRSGQKFQPNKRSGPSPSRSGQRGPARQSRNSTRRRA
jgi:23S rRNA pseudouridine2605 synthase